jgi:hypothetical protein
MLNKYFEDNYNKLKDMAYNITSGKDEDLLSFVIEELYKCDQKRINEIIKKKQMTFYVARVMLNQYHSKTSRYYYKYRKYYELHISGIIESICPEFVTKDIDNKKDIELKLNWVNNKLKNLHWFDVEVFKIYYRENHSLNTMAEVTKINRNTLYKSINHVKKYLINEK